MSAAFCARLRGPQAHLDEDGMCWDRRGNADSYLRARKMMVDPHPRLPYTLIGPLD